jgi:selenoprotein W-related protein
LAESILHDYYEQIPGGITLVPGSGGVFEIFLGDQQLFSKEETGRFPDDNEIEDKLEAILMDEEDE